MKLKIKATKSLPIVPVADVGDWDEDAYTAPAPKLLKDTLPVESTSLRSATVIQVSGLDEEKTYGLMFFKPHRFKERMVMPATGLEIRRHGRAVFELNVVKHFANSSVPKGYRLVEFPDTPLMLAVCTWDGPKYVPTEEALPPERKSKRLKIGKKYDNYKFRAKKRVGKRHSASGRGVGRS